MAKGVEDTAFYSYNRLLALNEVGGDPGKDGVTLDEFHQYNAHMQQTHPNTMLTLSTHDTKRSDDARARLAVLSEIPETFGEAVERWSQMNAKLRQGEWPDRGTEWFLYQTLVGTWPIEADRLKQYMQKAMREAKTNTSWVAHNAAYEEGVDKFVDAALGDEEFTQNLQKFVDSIVEAGWVNSLAQTLLKHTSPGVPDLYQGSELWDFSLVDPDNRRPVDYGLRRKLLAQIEVLDPASVMARRDEGLPKLWVIHRALQLRAQHPEWFGSDAAYKPLIASGPRCKHVVAYQRGESVVTVAPRLTMTLADDWQETTVDLPQGKWTNLLGDTTQHEGKVQLSDLLRAFPVALLVTER